MTAAVGESCESADQSEPSIHVRLGVEPRRPPFVFCTHCLLGENREEMEECEGSPWCLCYSDYWSSGVVMDCRALPPAEAGDYFRATEIYVDGEPWVPDSAAAGEQLQTTQVSLFTNLANIWKTLIAWRGRE